MKIEIMALFVAVLSFMMAKPICMVKHVGMKTLLILISPLILAYLTYWGIAWITNATDPQLDDWSSLFISICSVAGFAALLFGCWIFTGKASRKCNTL